MESEDPDCARISLGFGKNIITIIASYCLIRIQQSSAGYGSLPRNLLDVYFLWRDSTW